MLKAEYVAAAISRKSTASCTFVVNLFCHVSRKVVSKDFVKKYCYILLWSVVWWIPLKLSCNLLALSICRLSCLNYHYDILKVAEICTNNENSSIKCAAMTERDLLRKQRPKYVT